MIWNITKKLNSNFGSSWHKPLLLFPAEKKKSKKKVELVKEKVLNSEKKKVTIKVTQCLEDFNSPRTHKYNLQKCLTGWGDSSDDMTFA